MTTCERISFNFNDETQMSGKFSSNQKFNLEMWKAFIWQKTALKKEADDEKMGVIK